MYPMFSVVESEEVERGRIFSLGGGRGGDRGEEGGDWP